MIVLINTKEKSLRMLINIKKIKNEDRIQKLINREINLKNQENNEIKNKKPLLNFHTSKNHFKKV